jgi:hypothetical protein
MVSRGRHPRLCPLCSYMFIINHLLDWKDSGLVCQRETRTRYGHVQILHCAGWSARNTANTTRRTWQYYTITGCRRLTLFVIRNVFGSLSVVPARAENETTKSVRKKTCRWGHSPPPTPPILHQEVKTYLPGLSTPSEVSGGPRSIGR